MEDNRSMRETDLVLPPGTHAFILDTTKGNVTVYCGPNKASLSQTDNPVVYNSKTDRFDKCSMEKSIQVNVAAQQGEYVVLSNPADKQPMIGTSTSLTNDSLKIGQRIVMPGPAAFALWPGQVATVVTGHDLKSNQYLLVRVYDEASAEANKDKGVVKAVDGSDDQAAVSPETIALVTGKLMVIKGTDISFYIPPTGIEVLREDSSYVREAVTLERLEYCILLDESGNKNYHRGPDVVFPKPTEKFVTNDNGKRKFRAYELNNISGLYIKVIQDYEEDDVSHKAGDELFITGKEQAIYYPREEHAIIKYADKEKHYAVAIPGGEGRYVLDRLKGNVDLRSGPEMFLPNPINQVVVRRVLDTKTCELLYPGNQEAKDYNIQLSGVMSEEGYVEDSAVEALSMATAEYDSFSDTSPMRGYAARKKSLMGGRFGDELNRATSHTPPRTITLDTKYEGAVALDVWTGFAVQIVDKQGNRRIVQGPKTVLLQYDESLERMSLSRGRPKDQRKTLETVYLKVMSNPVNDVINVKTRDLVDVVIKLKYLVRFTGDNSKWFDVDNYVQYLCDHLRSLIGNHVRQVGVQEFYSTAAEFLRDLVLGVKKSDEDKRPNRFFEENDMEVYDLEILDVEIQDEDISYLLSNAHESQLRNVINLEAEERKATFVTGQESARREVILEQAETERVNHNVRSEEYAAKAKEELAQVTAQNFLTLSNVEARTAEQEETAKRLEVDRAQRTLDEALRSGVEDNNLDRLKDTIAANANAYEKRAKAIQPEMVAALTAIAQSSTFKEMAKHLAPLAIVRNESVSGTLEHLLKGTGMEHMLKNLDTLGTGKFVNSNGEVVEEGVGA